MIPKCLRRSLAVRAFVITLLVGMSFAIIGVTLRLLSYHDYVLAAAERETTVLAESVVLAVESVREIKEIERYFSALSAVPRVVGIHFVAGAELRVIASSERSLTGAKFEGSLIPVSAGDVDRALAGSSVFVAPMDKDDRTYEVIMPCLYFGSDYSDAGRSLDSVVIIEISHDHLWSFYGAEVLRDGVLLGLLIILSALAAYYFVHRKVLLPVAQLESRFFETAENHGFVLDKEIASSGELKSLVSYHDYVSERLADNERKLKEALLEARKLARISERTNNGIVVTNPEGEVEWANKGFERLTGYSLEEVRGKRPGSILQGVNTSQETVRELRATLAEKRPVKVEILNYRKNGDPYWVRIDIEPLFDEQGHLDSYVGLQYDIGAEKTREAAIMEAKDAAESLAVAKSNFLSVVSHEIRTPLNGVIGMIELLKEGGELNEEQEELIGIANDCSGTLLALINDILDFSKIESGYLELESVPLDLRKIAGTVYRSTQRAALEGVDYDWSVDPGISGQLHGDPTRITQLLFNLCSNALKFTKAGRVDLELKLVRRAATKEFVELSIRDTGIGIEPEKMEHIFEPFTQAQNSTTREFGGTGLGLAICRRICDSMGAELKLESRVGEGTVVRVFVPFVIL